MTGKGREGADKKRSERKESVQLKELRLDDKN
jgi:hypothetical protein